MKKTTLRLLMLAGCWMWSGASLLQAAPLLVHQPVVEASPGQPLEISATVTDPAAAIVQVRLYYRATGTLGYREMSMQGAGFNYSCTIPGSQVPPEGLEYYLAAANQNHELVTSPPLNAPAAPYRVLSRGKIQAPVLTLLAPEEGAQTIPAETVIVVKLDAGFSQIDLSSLKVILDEKNITSQVEKSGTLLTYAVPENLAPGLHGVQVTVRNTEGVETVSPTWSFEIITPRPQSGSKTDKSQARTARGFQLHGNVSLETQQAALTQQPENSIDLNQPEGWLNRGRVSILGQTDNFSLVGSAYATSEERPGQQPIGRFYLELLSPHWELTLGDAYPVFTEFSLNNSFVRGAIARWIIGDAKQGHSEMVVAGGWNKIAVPGETSLDPLYDRTGTFERFLGGVRWLTDFAPGIGISVNAGGVQDNAASLPAGQRGSADPVANYLASAETHITLPFSAWFSSAWFGEYALATYYQSDNFLTWSAGDAVRAGTRWTWGDAGNYAACEFKRTGADFVNEANPWLLGDSRGVYGDAQVHLLGSDLVLTGNANFYQDNLNGQKNYQIWNDAAHNTATVNATTDTTYLAGMLLYRLLPCLSNLSLGCSVNTNQDKTEPAPIVDNRTELITCGLGTQVPLSADQLLVNLTYTLSQYQDLAGKKLSGDVATSAFLTSLSYIHGSWTAAFSAGVTRNDLDESGLGNASSLLALANTSQQKTDYVLWNARASWHVLPGRLDAGVTAESLAGHDDISRLENHLFTVGVNSRYYFSSTHSLGLTLSNIRYQDLLFDRNSYAEFVANLNYAMGF